MALCIKQKVFSWRDKYDVYDEKGNPVYHVVGEVFTLGHKIHVYDLKNNEVAFIKQKVWNFLDKYEIYINNELKGTIKQKFSFFKPKYEVDFLNWKITGDIFEWNYTMTKDDKVMAALNQKTLVWSNTFCIETKDKKDELSALTLALAIDATREDNNAAIYYYGY